MRNDNGLPDLLIGERSGAIRFFENVGTVTAVFNQQATHTNFEISMCCLMDSPAIVRPF